MLSDLVEYATELVTRPFAVAEQRFIPDNYATGTNAYQEFKFLQNLLAQDEFQAALHTVLSRPYVSWTQSEERRTAHRGWRGGAAATRELGRSGPRVPSKHLLGAIGEYGLPAELTILRTDPTFDNTPNRFIKFVLKSWLATARAMTDANPDRSSALGERREREGMQVIQMLERALAADVFTNVPDERPRSVSNPVLRRRPGYREMLQAFTMSQLAATLSWSGGESVYRVGQKNVARLYEYWCFIQVARLIASMCGREFDQSDFLRLRDGRVEFSLAEGREVRLTGTVRRLNRQIGIELFYNRTFGSARAGKGSWTRVFRPDFSLRLRHGKDVASVSAEELWIHFDAKYRVDHLRDVLDVSSSDSTDDDGGKMNGRAKSDDLAKMHSYRDAIRRSAGAFVLYPGSLDEVKREFVEVLPGLGAFALRPDSSRTGQTSVGLKNFLEEVVGHFASQYSQHSRGLFWRERAFGSPSITIPSTPFLGFLAKPPRDTRVLVGYVRNAAHMEWITSARQYNIRADARTGAVSVDSELLGSEILVLYAPTIGEVRLWRREGPVTLRTADQLRSSGYQNPRGSLYLCLTLGRDSTNEWTEAPDPTKVERAVALLRPDSPRGAPIACTWDDFCTALGSTERVPRN